MERIYNPVTNPDSFLPGTNFSFTRNIQASSCKMSSIQQLGTKPEIKLIRPAHETGPAQLPTKNVLFEACSINRPLNARLREAWSTGQYYFMK